MYAETNKSSFIINRMATLTVASFYHHLRSSPWEFIRYLRAQIDPCRTKSFVVVKTDNFDFDILGLKRIQIWCYFER